MQSTYQHHEPAPESDGMQGPETVTSRAPREIPQEFFAQRKMSGMNSQQDLNYIQQRTPQFPQRGQHATPEPSRTRHSSDNYTPPAPFNMGTLHAALPHERNPNAGASSQWSSQSNPQYPHVPGPAAGGHGYGTSYGYGTGYGYGQQYPPNMTQQTGAPGGYVYHDPQGGFNQGAAYGGRPYYSQSAGGYHYG